MGAMFDWNLFRERRVRVLLDDGSRYIGRYRLIVRQADPLPVVWLTDMFLEHMLSLDTVVEIEALPSVSQPLAA